MLALLQAYLDLHLSVCECLPYHASSINSCDARLQKVKDKCAEKVASAVEEACVMCVMDKKW